MDEPEDVEELLRQHENDLIMSSLSDDPIAASFFGSSSTSSAIAMAASHQPIADSKPFQGVALVQQVQPTAKRQLELSDVVSDLAPPKRAKKDAPPSAEETGAEAKVEYDEPIYATSLITGEKFEMRLRKRVPESTALPGGSIDGARTGNRIAAMFERIDRDRLSSSSTAAADPVEPTKSAVETQLLVQKHSPTSYTSLVTDERLNREVLEWLMEWKQLPQSGKLKQGTELPDPLVLLCGQPGCGKTTLAHVLARQAGYNVVEVNASDLRTTESFERILVDTVSCNSILQDGKQSLLLLDEIDGIAGSDGRGAVDVLVRIVKASAGARKARGKPPSTADGDSGAEDGKKKEDKAPKDEAKKRRAKKRTATVAVRRPIVCTCNDLYAPALRELRKVARVVYVNKPNSQRFVDALKRVCKAERIAADGAALAALCDVSNYDLRAALNTLEFARETPPQSTAARKKPGVATIAITREMIQKAAVGEKDVERSIFDLWRAILLGQPLASSLPASSTSHPSMKQRERERDSGGDSDSKVSSWEMDELHRAIDASGEWERVLDGCWANHLKLGTPDHLLSRAIACCDWTCHSDCISGRAQRRGMWSNGTLSSLSSVAAIAYRSNSRGSQPLSLTSPSFKDNIISFPRIHSTMWKRRKELSDIASSFEATLPPEHRMGLRSGVLEAEFLPFLLTTLTPNVKLLNSTLMSKADKETIGNVAGVMAMYGLTYGASVEQNGDGTTFDPPIDKLLAYGGQVLIDALGFDQNRPFGAEKPKPAIPFAVSRRSLQVALKKMIAADIDAEKWRKMEESRRNAPNAQKHKADDGIQPVRAIAPKKPTAATPATQPKLRRDFFGRVIATPQAPPSSGEQTQVPGSECKQSASSPGKCEQKSPTKTSAHSSTNVRYRFQEGFTNAVRRKLFVKDML